MIYFNGVGVVQEVRRGFEWLAKSADQGLKEAQFVLALHYRDGIGVAANPNRAYHLCRRASKQGHAEATALLPSLRAACAPMECHAPECSTFEAVYGDFQICGGCRQAKYCGLACQRAHWRAGHKEECQRASSASAASKK